MSQCSAHWNVYNDALRTGFEGVASNPGHITRFIFMRFVGLTAMKLKICYPEFKG
jgi:hypothetical protein